MTSPQNTPSAFGNVLREWRARRRLSQLELSLLSATSARHISFLEKGRSNPSREMIQKLAISLEVPPSEANNAMLQAGFAPIFPKAELDDASVATLRSAITTMLDNHMPYPALACDTQWNLLQSNPAANNLLHLMGADNTGNVMQIMLAADDPDGPIINWPEVARLLLQRLNTEQLNNPTDKLLQAIRTKLRNHPRINEGHMSESTLDVVVPVRIRAENQDLAFVSMVAQFGAVQEVTYSGVHVELFFPDDQVTRDYLFQ